MAERIVLAHADARARRMLAAALVAWGHEVYEVYDGASALKLALRKQPEAVVLDVVLPRLDGPAACRAIRDEPALAATRVLLLVGQGHGPAPGCCTAGADLCLAKPVSPHDVAAAVADLLPALRPAA